MKRSMQSLLWLTIVLATSVFLTGCGGSAGYTIQVNAEVRSISIQGNESNIEQTFYYNPITEELVRVVDEINDFNSAKKVAEAGYQVVEGNFLTGPTRVVSTDSSYRIDYIFTPKIDDLEGGSIQVINNLKPFPDYGEYYVHTTDMPHGTSPAVSVINDTSPDSRTTVGLVTITRSEGYYTYSRFLYGAYQALRDHNAHVDDNQKIGFVTIDVVEGDTAEETEAAIETAMTALIDEHEVDVILSGLIGYPGATTVSARNGIPYFGLAWMGFEPEFDDNNFVVARMDGAANAAGVFAARELAGHELIVLSESGGWDDFITDSFNQLGPTSGSQTVAIGYGSESYLENTFLRDRRVNNGADSLVIASGHLTENADSSWFRHDWRIFSVDEYVPEETGNAVQEFVRFYDGNFNKTPASASIWGYEAGRIVCDILSSVKDITKENIVKAALEGQFATATGSMSFDANGVDTRTFAVIEYPEPNKSELYGFITSDGELTK